ncbi:MAG: hypothetical protein R3B13_39035 [Polyangiaceae bacterium]
MARSIHAIWPGFVIGVAAACGSTGKDPAGTGTGGGGTGGIAAVGGNAAGAGTAAAAAGGDASASDSSIGDAIGFPDSQISYPDVVETDAWCAAEASVVTMTGCCNDLPCNGYCQQGEGDSIECGCFGILGGCQGGTVCCKWTFGCAAPDICFGIGGP